MIPLKIRSARKGSLPAAPKDRAFFDARDRLMGKRIQADIPAGVGRPLYRRGYLRDLLPDHMALMECDNGQGDVWVHLDHVTLLEAA